MNGGIGVELSWLQSLIMGLFSGVTDILPVSSQAHQTLLLTFFGEETLYPVLRLAIHAAILITLLIACRGEIGHIRRQLRLTRLPRRRRNRMPDLAALMDAKIVKTAFWPVALLMLLQGWTCRLGGSLLWVAILSLVNAVILYLPNLYPTADKDSRLVTPGESLEMGLGAGISILPGISSVGAAYSAGIIHGVDRGYMIHLTLMIHMLVTAGLMVHDVLDILALGAVDSGTGAIICYGLSAIAAAAGTVFGVRNLRRVAARQGLTGFSFYSFGVALFTFILYLVV